MPVQTRSARRKRTKCTQYSIAQKLAILDEAKVHGIKPTARQHGINKSMLIRWRQQSTSLKEHATNREIGGGLCKHVEGGTIRSTTVTPATVTENYLTIHPTTVTPTTVRENYNITRTNVPRTLFDGESSWAVSKASSDTNVMDSDQLEENDNAKLKDEVKQLKNQLKAAHQVQAYEVKQLKNQLKAARQVQALGVPACCHHHWTMIKPHGVP
jgi:hypothetical protein